MGALASPTFSDSLLTHKRANSQWLFAKNFYILIESLKSYGASRRFSDFIFKYTYRLNLLEGVVYYYSITHHAVCQEF